MIAELQHLETKIENLFASADQIKADLQTVKQTVADLTTLLVEVRALVTALTAPAPAPKT